MKVPKAPTCAIFAPLHSTCRRQKKFINLPVKQKENAITAKELQILSKVINV